MMIFAVCLLAAGAVLSLLTRVHGLLIVVAGTLAVCAVAALLRTFSVGSAYPVDVTLVVAIAALQLGYGLGIVTRAAFGSRLRRPAVSVPGVSGPDAAPAREPEQPFSHES